MPYRVDYRESVALTESEHDSVITAVETWADGAPNRRFPFYQRHRERGETEIHVIVGGLTYDQTASMQDQIKNGTDTLPGTWPDPTEVAGIHRYTEETQS